MGLSSASKGRLLAAVGSMGEFTEVASAKRGVRGDLSEGAVDSLLEVRVTETAMSLAVGVWVSCSPILREYAVAQAVVDLWLIGLFCSEGARRK